MPQLIGANIIDGSGNDAYMGYIPDSNLVKRQKFSKYLKYIRYISKHFSSTNLLHIIG